MNESDAPTKERGNTPKTNSSIVKGAGVLIIAVLAWIIISSASSINSPQQSNTISSSDTNTNTPSVAASTEKPSVPAEYTSALTQATSYANTMHMSKQGVYDQLVSSYGGQFPAAAAQYAIDNVKADWNANALAKAKDYQDKMHLSRAAIHDQLTSSYGEKFSAAEADYAIQHLGN